MQTYKVFDPNPRAPNPLPPPGSCDCQFHIFAAADKYPVRPGAVYHTPEATIEAAVRMHTVLGLQRGVIVNSTAYGTDYRIMLDGIAAAGPGYRGIAVIDDTITDADYRRMDDGGVRGVRFNFVKRLNMVPSLGTFQRLVDRVAEMGWFIKVHGSGQDLLDLAELLRPIKANAVIDHLTNPDFGLPVDQPIVRFCKDLLAKGNWWVMLSNGDRRSTAGRPWNDAVAFARAYVDAAPDRMIWGSDWPHPLVTDDMEMKNDGELLELLYRYCPNEEIKRKILVDNPARLLGFPPMS